MTENWERNYQPISKFVYVTINGNLTNSGLKNHLDTYRDECLEMDGLLELCELRGIVSTDGLAVSYVSEQAQETAEYNHFKNGRLAFVVANAVQKGYARAWMAFGEQAGRNVAMFTELNDAIMFLYEGEWIKYIEATIEFVRSRT